MDNGLSLCGRCVYGDDSAVSCDDGVRICIHGFSAHGNGSGCIGYTDKKVFRLCCSCQS